MQVSLDILSSKYENIVIIDDFKSEPKASAIIDFCRPNNMENFN